MDLSLRLRLSVMMFLQYVVWGSWGLAIFTFVGSLPTLGGLNFSGDAVGWIGATLPIGAMISPLFIGLFADRLFSTEKVLAILHLLGAVLLGWAGWTCTQHLPQVEAAFRQAATAERVGTGNLLDALAEEKRLQDELKAAPEEQKAAIQNKLGLFQEKTLEPAVKRVNQTPEVAEAVNHAFWPLFSILLAYGLCFMPTLTLTNSISFRNLSDPDRYFGGIRVLGTIGWIAGGLVVSFFLHEASAQPLYLAAAVSVLLGLFCFFLPHTPPSGGAKTLGDSLGLPALAMLKERSFLVFFICSFLITIVLAFYFQLSHPFLTAINAPYPLAIQTLGQFSEIFFMLLLPVGLARIGTKGMLVIGMVAWCLRYAIFAWQNVPAVIFIGLPLHGICYDFFFVVAYLYVDRKAPKDLRASAQGMIAFVLLGLGMFLGNLVAGDVKGAFPKGAGTDWTSVWLVSLGGSLVATLLFALLFREPRTEVADVTVTKAMEGLEPVEPPEQVH
jgi:nucleoside transporter